MPDQMRIVAVGAGATADILANWRYRKIPFPALVTLLVAADEALCTWKLMSGTTEIVQAGSALQLATANTLPVPQTTPTVQFTAPYNDEVICEATDNVTANGFNALYWINIERAG